MVEDALDFLLLYGLAYRAAIMDRWLNVSWASSCFCSALIKGPNMLAVVARALLLVLLLVRAGAGAVAAAGGLPLRAAG
jgi:hypothetical protein